ncbi:lipopolysaccharide biosynthesis protein [candidate division KSB1 bacterium]
MEDRPVNYYVKHLFKHSAIYGLGDIGSKLLSFLLIPIHTYYLTIREYSIFSLFILFYSFMLTFYLLGINSGFIRHFLDEKHNKKNVFSSAFLFILIYNILLSILIAILSERLSYIFFNSPEYSEIFHYGAMILMLESLSTLTLLIYRALNNPAGFVKAILMKMFVIIISNILFLSVWKMGLNGAVLGNLAGSASLLLVLSFKIKKFLNLKFSLKLCKKMFKYGIPTVPAVTALTILIMIDQYLLKYFGYIDKVGIYAVGYKLGMALSIIISGFRLAWFPFIFQTAQQKNAPKIFSAVFNYFNLFLIFLYLIISIYIPVFFKYIFPNEYYESVNLIPIVALGYVFYGYYENFMVGVYIKDKTNYIAVIITISALLNITLNFILIPAYNIYGAAIATAVSYIFLAVLGYVISQRFFSVDYDFINSLKALITGSIILACMYAFGSYNIIIKLALPLCYFPILYLLRFFKKEDIELVKRIYKNV